MPLEEARKDIPRTHGNPNGDDTSSDVAVGEVLCGVRSRRVAIAVVHSRVVGLINPLESAGEEWRLVGRKDHHRGDWHIEDNETRETHYMGNDLVGVWMDGAPNDSVSQLYLLYFLGLHHHLAAHVFCGFEASAVFEDLVLRFFDLLVAVEE